MSTFNPETFVIVDIRVQPTPTITGAYECSFSTMLIRRFVQGKLNFCSIGQKFPEIESRIISGHPVIVVDNVSPRSNHAEILSIFTTCTTQHNQPFPVEIFGPREDQFTMTVAPIVELPVFEADVLQVTKDPVNEIIPGLFLGCEDVVTRKDLTALNVQHVVSVMNQPPVLSPSFTRHHIPIADTFDQKIDTHFKTTFNFIDSQLTSSRRVLVHCQQGISRSATIVIMYIMRSQRISAQAAYEFVKTKRACIAPNLDFMGILAEFENRGFEF